MPSFAYRMNHEDSFTTIGNYPCYGWMASLGSLNIQNNPEEHIAEIRASYSDMNAWGDDRSHRDSYFDLMIKLANATPALKGRVQLAPSVMRSLESVERDTEVYGNSLQVNLVGVPVDVLMLHLFMLRNLSARHCFQLFKYLLEKGVPIKVAAIISSSFYVSVGAAIGSSANWSLGYMSGDSTIISGSMTVNDLRNFCYGSGFEGHQARWGDSEHDRGYQRDGDDGSYITNAFRRSLSGRVPQADCVYHQYTAQSRTSRGAAWDYINTLITQLVGKDFGISHEDANEKIQRIGR